MTVLFKFAEVVFKLSTRAGGTLSLISAHLSTNQLFISAYKQTGHMVTIDQTHNYTSDKNLYNVCQTEKLEPAGVPATIKVLIVIL